MKMVEAILIDQGIEEEYAGYLSTGIIVLGIILLCIIANIIMKKVVLRILTHYIKNNKYRWDDIMLSRKVFHRLMLIVPAVIIYMSAPVFINLSELIRRFTLTYILITAIFIISSILDSIDDIYRAYPISKVRPIKGLLQVVKIIIYIIFGIIVIANLMGESPLILISGFGALAAVFSFVFKDSILGFIAGIQLTSNDMLRIGDWIEMQKYGADGDVIDITLNTVKVQNFDKTIVTIPAYSLISDSFKNWRGMKEFGGRRIKRSIYIDINSIKFCTPQMIDKYKRIQYLRDYILEKEEEITRYNEQEVGEYDLVVNGKHLTNVGTFRAYILYYLKHNTMLHNDMVQMVRQLEPGPNGLPLEIYAFSKGTDFEVYETIQADIFDHIIAVAEEFDLRIFQSPTGYDVKHH
ncbi:MAG: putative rane protein [Herbinix sp.]|jgi:miniconductance mechanosensitive channel|nr:putative rane protein [Herbinix sp.]